MVFSENFEFTCPIKTISGSKSLEQLPVELDSLNARKPLVVTRRELAGKRVMNDFIKAFGDSGMVLGIFAGVGENPDWKSIEDLRKIYGEKEYDSIIALGSGVVMDVAKVLNIAVSLGVDARNIAKEPAMRRPLKPLAIVLTAAATGMETSRFAHFHGSVFSSIHLMPALVILDPRMTNAANGEEMASAVLAAFARSVEAFIARSKNPFTDAYAYAAVALVKEHALAASRKPGMKKTALAIANAAAMSGAAMSNAGAGMATCLGQALFEMFRLPHGVGMGICLPHILDYYRKQGGHPIAELLLPLAGPDEYAATPDSQKTDRALAIIGRMFCELRQTIGDKMPGTLKDAGVPRYMMEDILEKASLAGGDAFDKEACLAVIESAWEGKPAAEPERSV